MTKHDVIPAQAGIQHGCSTTAAFWLDPRVREDDEGVEKMKQKSIKKSSSG